MYDLIIRGGMVVTEKGVYRKDIAVQDEKIVEISDEISVSAKEEFDAKGLHVFPGAFDAHVHFDDPGRTEWETFYNGSQAVAKGGATAVGDMPLNSVPYTLDKKSFDIKNAVASKDSHVDYSLWGGLTLGVTEDMMYEMAEAGVIGFKAFLNFSGLDDYPPCDDYTLWKGMQTAKKLGLPVCVHCGNDSISKTLRQKAMAEGRTSAAEFMECQPPIIELEGIQRAVLIAEDTGCHLNVAHVGTARGVEMAMEARKRGANITVETIIYKLIITKEDMLKLGPSAKLGGGIRDTANREQLWEYTINGEIDTVVSDHSPANKEKKSGDDYFKIWGGSACAQNVMDAMLTEGFYKRGMPLPRIASALAGRTFDIYNIKGKGKIEVGYDADFAIVDMNKGFVLQEEDLLYKNKMSPFIGREFYTTVVRTILRGKTIYADGKIASEPIGKLIVPTLK